MQKSKTFYGDFEAGEFQSVLTPQRRKQLAKMAEETLKREQSIEIRISSQDLAVIQRQALEEGVPYQTLVSSILHQYVSGNLSDKF